MGKKSPEFDEYIARSNAFARPILERLRKLFHKACPQIEETMKWSFPHFQYKGIVGSMAAFKEHAGYGFWKGKLLKDPDHLLGPEGSATMLSAKVCSVSELPPDKVLLAYIREAVALNENEVKLPRKKKAPLRAADVPADLAAALKRNRKARATFEGFSPSHRREYIEWISEAKQPATRERRLATTLQWLAAGKPRNWKYTRTQ